MVKRLFVVIMISILLLSGCGKQKDVIPTLVESAIAEYDTAVVTRGDFYKLVTYDGKVYPAIQELYFNVDGTVTELNAYLGDNVKKGDIIMSIDYEYGLEKLAAEEKSLEETIRRNSYDNKVQDLDIQIAKLNIEKKMQENASEAEILRLETELEKLEIKKKQSLELQQFNMELAEKKVKSVQETVDNLLLKAPVDGEISYIRFDSLKYHTTAQTTVAVIAEKDTYYVQCSFINQATIRDASEVYAVINGKEYEIEYIPLEAADAAKMSKGVKIESKFRIQVDNNVQFGDYACIHIKDKLIKDVLLIPKKALFKEAGTQFVYIIEEGQLKRINVEVGTEMDTQVEIKSGLKEGDVLYVQG